MTGSAGLALAGRKGVWGVTTKVKLFNTGLPDPAVASPVAPAELDEAPLPEPDPEEPEELEELLPLLLLLLLLLLLEPVVDLDELDELDDPALALVVLLLEVVGGAAVLPEPLWPPVPLVPPELWPEPEVPVEFFPAVVPL